MKGRRVTWKTRIAGWIGTTALLAAAPAWAQIGQLPPLGLPSLPSGVAERLPEIGDIDRLGARVVNRTLQAPSRLRGLIRRSGGALEADPFGWPVVADEIVAIDLSGPARSRALDAGFTVVREERLEALDLTTTVLAPPGRLSLSRAVERLRDLNPETEVAFNHVHTPAGAKASPANAQPTPTGPQASSARLGLIDTGVEAAHPALAGSRITQRGFAGPPRMGAHGLAVASLMVGRSGPFSGGAPGEALLVADIYGGQAAGGSSTGLAQALSWMVEQRATVVNISLVGPRNALVARAVARAQARGATIVAAAGNDGPAAPPLYPAAYDGVIGVAAVNARDQALPEGARGPQIDFVAPGADMAAAAAGGTWTAVRGASFASPIVAGLLARQGGGPGAIDALARSAKDLGTPGRDPVYGAGLVGAQSRTAPRELGARGRLRR